MPEHQITSLLAGHENVTTLSYQILQAKLLFQQCTSCFISYLEGSSATPVAGSFTTKGIHLDNLLEEGRNPTGPQLLVKSLLRMLKDFHIIPKMLQEGTIFNCAVMSINLRPVVLTSISKEYCNKKPPRRYYMFELKVAAQQMQYLPLPLYNILPLRPKHNVVS